MFKKSKKSVKSLAITLVSLVLVGCGSGNLTKSNGTTNQKNPSIRNQLCENPIPLEEKEMEPVTDVTVLPKSTFKIARIQLHEFWEIARHSITVSADRSEGFDAKVDCQGFHNGEDIQNREITSSFHVTDTIDLALRKETNRHRNISYRFTNGELVDVDSVLIRRTGFVEKVLDHISTARIALKNGGFVTYRFYLVTPTVLEFRGKFEYPADENGDRRTSFFKAVFEAKNENPILN